MAVRERRKRALEPAKRKRQRPEHIPAIASEPGQAAAQKEEGFLFDPYWDDAFAAYFDPTLHVCCLLRY